LTVGWLVRHARIGGGSLRRTSGALRRAEFARTGSVAGIVPAFSFSKEVLPRGTLFVPRRGTIFGLLEIWGGGAERSPAKTKWAPFVGALTQFALPCRALENIGPHEDSLPSSPQQRAAIKRISRLLAVNHGPRQEAGQAKRGSQPARTALVFVIRNGRRAPF